MRATLEAGVRELSPDGGQHDRPSDTVGLARRPGGSVLLGEAALHELALDRVRAGVARSRGPRRSVGAR